VYDDRTQVGPDPGFQQYGYIAFEGIHTPTIDLLDGEEVLAIFEAELWDLGLLGWLLGHKRRMVLTTSRVLHFRKRLIDNVLDIAWLRRVRFVTVGQEVKVTQFLIGLGLVVFFLIQLAGSCTPSPISGFSIPASSGVMDHLGSVTGIAVGVVAIIMSRRKVMQLSTGIDKISMELTRLRSEESRRFVETIFSQLSRLEPEMQKLSHSAEIS